MSARFLFYFKDVYSIDLNGAILNTVIFQIIKRRVFVKTNNSYNVWECF